MADANSLNRIIDILEEINQKLDYLIINKADDTLGCA